jgi:hypothetical protein
MSPRHMEDHEREAMVDSILCRRVEEPTRYTAPGKDQKWKARNVVSFHFRHFAYKVPSAYRDVLLCAIDHANPTTGRCDVGQRRIGRECNLTRQTVNEAMRWWEENTYFLRIESRPGRTNAYHIQWDALETDWYAIQERVVSVTPTPAQRHADVKDVEVSALTRHPVSALTRRGGVGTDPTLNVNKNLNEEPHHEMARSLTANDAHDDFLANQSGEIIRMHSERVERFQGFQGDERRTAEPVGLDPSWWIDRLNDAEAELQHCDEPVHRKRLEEKIARCRAHLEELHHEQRSKVGQRG